VKPERCHRSPTLPVLAVATFALAISSAALTPARAAEVVATSTDTAPGGGAFGRFEPLGINNAGQVLFTTLPPSGSPRGIYLGGPTGNAASVEKVMRFGEPSPSGVGATFGSFFPVPVHNDVGRVAFSAMYSSTEYRLYTGGGGAPAQIGGPANPVPGGGTFQNIIQPAINNAGQVAVAAGLASNGGTGIFRRDATGFVPILRSGQAVPAGHISAFVTHPAINSAGQVAVLAEHMVPSGTDMALYRGDGTSLVSIARTGDAAPDGNGTLRMPRSNVFVAGRPRLNDAGQVAFVGTLQDTALGAADDSGIYRGDGATLLQVAREGQAAPGAAGMSFRRFHLPLINDAGQVAFIGNASAPGGHELDHSGVYVHDGAALAPVALRGQRTPTGGTFAFFNSLALNDAGQVAFESEFADGATGGATGGIGIFAYDPVIGLIQVARDDEMLLGSRVTDVRLVTDPFNGSPLNDRGEVVYIAQLFGGREVLVVTPIPEPAALAAGTPLLLLLARRRPRRG
jgi:hypothetical protein